MSAYQPKTGAKCGCRRGVQRDNCPHCEGTGMVIDFKAILARGGEDMNIQPKIAGATHTPGPWTADGANLLYAAPSEEDQFEVIEVNAPYNTQDRLLIASIPAGFADSAANAALIAAAPAIYEALKQTFNVVENILTDSQLDTRTPCGLTIREWESKVRIALAQAEGKQ